MTMHRQLVAAQVNVLGDREVEVVMSTSALARDGHVLVPQGCQLANYRANPIVLWQHDPDFPIGNAADIVVEPEQIRCRIVFAPAGISAKADEICGLMKAAVVRAVSVGFDPIEGEPLDPKRPRGGQRFTVWELLELSAVSVGADVSALVTNRANGDKSMADWKVGAAKDLPIEDSDAWDGAAAEASIFEWAGGDKFDAAKARKGFLVYDASRSDERGGYELPIAHAVDGELKVPKGAIRAAASRLPDTDIPDEVKTDAGKVLDAYKEKAGIGEDDQRAARRPARTRARRANGVRAAGVLLKRGVYDVADLCWVFECLGYHVDMAKFESALEGDNSKVPAMLAAVFQDLGDALLAMAQEEIAEALANHDVEVDGPDEDDDLVVEERAHIRAASSPAVRAFRRGLARAKLRAGKTLSADSVEAIRDAMSMMDEGAEHHRSGLKKHREAKSVLGELLDRAGISDEADDEAEANAADPAKEERMDADFRRRAAELRLRRARG